MPLPTGKQRIIPYLTYKNPSAAIEFLGKAFGFSETMRLAMPDGRIGHAEIELGNNTLMLASAFEEMGLTSPQDLPSVHCQVVCYVDDVDAHHDRALAAGATIAQPPTDQFYGDRNYRAIDPEGHRWTFATHVRDVAVEDMSIPE